MPWYKRLNEILTPMEGLVNFSLIIIILISFYMLFQTPAKKTAWLVYVVSP